MIPSTKDLMVTRHANGSKPGKRTDPYWLTATFESGGQAGVINAGYASALLASGLVDALDEIRGSSAGGMAAAHLAAGTVIAGATIYPCFNCDGRFLRLRRLASSRAVMNLDYLVDEAFVKLSPLDWDALTLSPWEVHVETASRKGHVPLRLDGQNYEAQRAALKATARVPLISTGWNTRKFELFDGVISGSFAASAQTTHTLVLRNFRHRQATPERWETHVVGPFIRRHDPLLALQLAARHSRKQTWLDQFYGTKEGLMIIEPLGHELKSSCRAPYLLWQALGLAWKRLFAEFGLEPMPYPDEWHEGRVSMLPF